MPHLLTLQHLEKGPPTHPPLTEAPGSIPGGQTLALFPLCAPHPFPPEKNIEEKTTIKCVCVCVCVCAFGGGGCSAAGGNRAGFVNANGKSSGSTFNHLHHTQHSNALMRSTSNLLWAFCPPSLCLSPTLSCFFPFIFFFALQHSPRVNRSLLTFQACTPPSTAPPNPKTQGNDSGY